MPQVIEQQGNIFGRIGKGFGQGLSEQLPKEVDRYRLSKGLKQFEQDSGNLTPLQQLTRLASIPGATEHPELIRSFSDLAKQQGISNALKKKSGEENEPKPNPFPKPKNITEENASPSITTRAPIEATLENYIPKTFDQIQQRAGKLLEENPALYANDPQKALSAAVQEDAQAQSINNALQTRRSNEQNVQNKVEEGLTSQRERLGAEVPGTVYSEIEDKALNAVKPVSQGGEGLTEQQAKKKYGDELDKISRDYKAVETIGTGKVFTRTPKGNKEALRSIREKFKERDDLENLANTYISKNGLSPSKAYYLAYPVSESKEINNIISKTPTLEKTVSYKKGYPEIEVPKEYVEEKTLDLSKKLAPLLKDNQASPLSIAEELKSRNYDPQIWMNYVDKNRKSLDLSERQGRELDQTRDFTNTLNDLWMFYFSGLDNLVEQK